MNYLMDLFLEKKIVSKNIKILWVLVFKREFVLIGNNNTNDCIRALAPTCNQLRQEWMRRNNKSDKRRKKKRILGLAFPE